MKRKKKICKECGDEKFLYSRGRCQLCASKTYKKPKKATDTKKQQRKERSDKMKAYFDHHIERCKFSEDSGAPIHDANRSNCCHLYPKRIYKSVEDNLENCVYLLIGEHNVFDAFMDRHDFKSLEVNFPNAWPIVVERMKKLLPYVTENKALKIKFEKYLEEREK